MLRPDLVRAIRRAPRRAPCPHCGRRARRKRIRRRRLRSLAYRRAAWLEVTYAEYHARCGCCKYFRTWPLDVPAKADYDTAVRQAVLDRLLRDRLNVEQTKAAMQRDFLVTLSDGFIYDCLRWQLTRLDLAQHRRLVIERFSGTLCVDELHLGAYTLLLATDPLADLPVGFALVSANDQEHMRRFLYPELLAEIWPAAAHQLCLFHVLRDMLDQVLDAVRRLRRAQARRGRAGRKRRRGRPRQGQQARRRQRGPTAKQKATFVWRRRFLIAKRQARLTEAERQDLAQLFAYLPELRTLWKFSQDLYRLLDESKTLRVARWRWTWLRYDPQYQEVRVARVGVAEVDDLRRVEAVLAGAIAILVVVDQVGRVELTLGDDVLAGEDPDRDGDAEGAGLEIPVGAAVHLLVEGGELPEVELVVYGVDLFEQLGERVVDDGLNAVGLAVARRDPGVGAEGLLRAGGEGARLAAGLGLALFGGDVERRRVGGADGRVDGDAGPGGVLELGEQLVGGGLAGALEGVDVVGPGPLLAGEGVGDGLAVNGARAGGLRRAGA